MTLKNSTTILETANQNLRKMHDKLQLLKEEQKQYNFISKEYKQYGQRIADLEVKLEQERHRIESIQSRSSAS